MTEQSCAVSQIDVGRAWLAGKWNADIEGLFTDCIGIVIAFFIVPWRYVWARYVVQPMEPLRRP